MIEKKTRHIILNIIDIIIDIFNLAEQLGIYFIVKQNDLDETAQQRFFFILFGVGAASLFKPLFVHPSVKTAFGLCIDIAELVSYLTLLTNTTSLLIVAILFFILEAILRFNLAMFETQILFLFVDPTSPFRDTFYEILMVLSTFFGVITVEKLSAHLCHMNNDEDEDEDKIYSIWEGFIAILTITESFILIITAVVYAVQLVQNRSQLKTYDFVIYIIILVYYGSTLFALACAFGFTLCLCAGA
ncbi:unnamed protein product, partial [Adineta steineri]